MKNFNYLILFFCWSLYLFVNKNRITCAPYKGKSLKLVYVLFRHGNRTPNGPEEVYPKDPHRDNKYEPFGLGQLTNAGKRKEYRIGKALRERYDSFIGPYCNERIVEPISTYYNRAKMSLLLTLYALCPPRGKLTWKENVDYLPIPYNYLPRSQDKVLLGSLCPYYLKLYEAYIKTAKTQKKFGQYQKTFKYISKHCGLNVTTFKDVYNMQFGLKAEEDCGLPLPHWTEAVWPERITKLAIKEYFIATGTTDLRRMASGYFIQKLLIDIYIKMDGSTPERKIYLNSAHEDNIANLLIALGLFDPPHIPEYGAYLIFELHKIFGRYGIKIYYQNYVSEKPRLLKLPACDTFCEINAFRSLVEEYIPLSDNMCYWE